MFIVSRCLLLAKYVHAHCQRQASLRVASRRACVPARFLVVCENGHLDDFPYVDFVHATRAEGVCDGPQLTMSDAASTLGPRVTVRCVTCDHSRSIQEAAGSDGWQKLPVCRGRHPHLQRFYQCGKLVSYATHNEPSIKAALSAATARNVAVTLLAERHEDNPSYTAAGTPFPGLNVLRLHWPASSRPPGAALHAKIIVVDDQVALVGSANLTSRAMESNLECGILIRGGPQPRAIRDHITGLHAAEVLLRL